MTPERRKELMENPQLELTGEELASGCHFCDEWDGLVICKDDPEYEVTCKGETK